MFAPTRSSTSGTAAASSKDAFLSGGSAQLKTDTPSQDGPNESEGLFPLAQVDGITVHVDAIAQNC